MNRRQRSRVTERVCCVWTWPQAKFMEGSTQELGGGKEGIEAVAHSPKFPREVDGRKQPPASSCLPLQHSPCILRLARQVGEDQEWNQDLKGTNSLFPWVSSSTEKTACLSSRVTVWHGRKTGGWSSVGFSTNSPCPVGLDQSLPLSVSWFLYIYTKDVEINDLEMKLFCIPIYIQSGYFIYIIIIQIIHEYVTYDMIHLPVGIHHRQNWSPFWFLSQCDPGPCSTSQKKC